MSNPSRETGPNDRWTKKAKSKTIYWLCECGLAREGADHMVAHCRDEDHFAERINSDTGTVIGFLAAGLEHEKYGNEIPSTAHIQREKNKNDPLFKDPEYNDTRRTG